MKKIYLLFFVIVACSSRNNNATAEQQNWFAEQAAERKKKAEESEPFKLAEIEKESRRMDSLTYIYLAEADIKGLDKYYRTQDYYSSKDGLGNIIANLQYIWADINAGMRSDADSTKRLAYKVKDAIKANQPAIFSKLRRAYGELKNKELWIQDAKVKVFGKSNRTIRFIHGSFIKNAAIADFYKEIEPELLEYRFTRAEFCWSEYAEYTYYNVSTRDDDDLVN